MTRIGLPGPGGFTVTTDACRADMESGGFPDGFVEEIDAGQLDNEERGRIIANCQLEQPLGTIWARDIATDTL